MLSEYAEALEELRAWLAQFKQPDFVKEDGPPPFTNVQVARRRFALACVALNVPDAQIDAALPGFDPDIRRLSPRWIPKTFAPGPFVLGRSPEEYIKSEIQRFEQYLREQVEQARRQCVQVGLRKPPQHRITGLDVAERYFVTVRKRILNHRYSEIAHDHVTPTPKTERELAKAENRLKGVVHAVSEEVRFGQNLTVEVR
jgi:hypothetical protein